MSENPINFKYIYQEIIKIFFEYWDPIGVKNIPEAQDEYDSYAYEIYIMLIAKNSKYEIFEYLCWLETEYMGLNGDQQRAEQCAKRLIDLIE